MDPGITDVASYLATQIATGADTEAQAIEDWRATLYNARRTNALPAVADLVRRCAPEDEYALALCTSLRKR
jgi:hypothetical protein